MTNIKSILQHFYFQMDKLCIRSYIKTRWFLYLTPTQIHEPDMNDIIFNYLEQEKIKLMAHPPYSP